MDIHVLTLFPKMFQEVLSDSILKIAQEKGLLRVFLHNFRDFAQNKHKKVDDRPYGGGPGMVLGCEPIFLAIESLRNTFPEVSHRLILLSPQGKPYHQNMAITFSQEKSLILVCGHYEGFDERIIEGLQPEEISIGDYVLTGGEIPAMVLIDSISRLIPGVLGDPESNQKESFNFLLDYPQYTRPAEFRGMNVPEILLHGHHQEIENWRKTQALLRTQQRRPDLLNRPYKS
ncbi:MAG: tRNA (guanosine(37)-N1)-methyltransferase TrmD [Planctomycetota bacterium]